MNPPSPSTNTTAKTALTPELVKAITDRVYALLLADLRLERERGRGIDAQPPSNWRRR